MFFEFHKPIPLWKKILHAKLHILWLMGLKMLVAKAFIMKLLAVKAVFAAETVMAIGASMAPMFSFASTPTVIQALPEHPAPAENTIYDTIAEQNKGIIIDNTLKENNKEIIAQAEGITIQEETENNNIDKIINVSKKRIETNKEVWDKKKDNTSTAMGITTLRGYTDEERYRLHPELKPSIFKQIENSL
jgi:hypothetical protein